MGGVDCSRLTLFLSLGPFVVGLVPDEHIELSSETLVFLGLDLLDIKTELVVTDDACNEYRILPADEAL